MRLAATLIALCALLTTLAPAAAEPPDAVAIVKAGFDYYRGLASEAEVEMVIHRPTWERTMGMRAWTKGTDKSLIRITAPPKDEGNGTLKIGHEMWTFNPKVNRVIKLPPALMAQSWLGSDFSNNDLAKSDSILNDYTHTLKGTEAHEGHTVYVIESMPKPAAPVVWGKQVLKIRDDHILLAETFFDEALAPVKRMTAGDIQMMGGRLFPKTWRMQEVDKPDEYTLLRYHALSFLDDLPERLFTLNALKTFQGR
ncbi:MAG: outer membrane lipoprotein-sorting protein [Desulfobacteraceae bacterium]|jgi:outer membrane lipoprotein-sorting protein|nr:outer membrane lipoprotein-sorting protein [Desulfobacteraceae bacterium]